MGYTGGDAAEPTYESVCRGDGHTEALLLRLDPAVLSYEQLIRRWLDDPRVATYPNPRTHAASPTLTTGPAALPVHHSAY